MVDEFKLLREASRTAEAQAILDNALFNEAIAKIELDLIKAWKLSPAADTSARERAWMTIQQLGKIKDYFEAVLNDGKLADKQLKDLAEADERQRLFMRR